MTLLLPTAACAICWVLAACTTYTPAPLDDPTTAASAASAGGEPLARLVVAASEIDHPLLEPVAIDLSDGLSPEEAAVLVVVANPDLRAARARRGVAEATILRAGLLPDPQLAATVERPHGNQPGTSTGNSVGLSWDLDPLFVRGAERASATAARDQVELDLAWEEWSIAQQARAQVFSALFLARQVELARDEEEALGSVVERLDKALDLHLVSRVEALAAADALGTARGTRIDLEGRLAKARLEVFRLLGAPAGTALAFTGNVERAAAGAAGLAATGPAFIGIAPEEPSRWLDGLDERRLDLLALRAGYRSQEEAVRAAVLRQFPRINVGVNRARDTGAIVTLGPALSISLPLLDRNRGEIAVARATREQLRQEYEARGFAARADVAGLLEELRQVARALDNATAAVPAARRLVEAYGEALRRRSADALTFYRARVDLLTKETTVVELQQELVRLGLELQIASGRYETLGSTPRETP